MKSKNREILFEIMRTAIAIALALLLAFVIIFIISDDPLDALQSFITGPVASLAHIGNVFEMAIPLLFTGLAASVMFEARQFNMIGEGSFYIGGLVAAMAAIDMAASPVPGLKPTVAILLGAAVGAVCGFVPGILKAKLKTDEFVVSLMLNYVIYYLGLFIFQNTIKDPQKGSNMSYIMPSNAKLPVIIGGTRIHAGILIAIAAVFLVYYFMYRTKWGYSLRMTGKNHRFAEYSGLGATAAVIYSQVIGGAIAGAGGATEILGMYSRFQWSDLPGYGFDGVMVAIIARQNPLLVPLGALFIAYMRVGANVMALNSDVPSEIISVIEGIVILLIVANGFLARWRHKVQLKYSTENEKKLPEGK